LTEFQHPCDTERAVLGLLLRGADIAYRWLHGLDDPDAQVGPILRVEVARHSGQTLRLRDGTEVRPRDRVGIIHLNNERVARLHGDDQDVHAGLQFRRDFVASLAELARQVAAMRRYEGVRAFTSETILHHGTQRAGFEILPLPNTLRSRLVAAYERAVLARYHPLGRRGSGRARFSEARAIWISRDELLRRYGTDLSAPRDAGS
jgi:hypothetical protein